MNWPISQWHFGVSDSKEIKNSTLFIATIWKFPQKSPLLKHNYNSCTRLWYCILWNTIYYNGTFIIIRVWIVSYQKYTLKKQSHILSCNTQWCRHTLMLPSQTLFCSKSKALTFFFNDKVFTEWILPNMRKKQLWCFWWFFTVTFWLMLLEIITHLHLFGGVLHIVPDLQCIIKILKFKNFQHLILTIIRFSFYSSNHLWSPVKW